jgi:TPP-dependent pyruvate/acetoin dehydrogenase alpha subunit
VAYEAFNMAALWKAPILFVVEHNHIAQTTPSSIALSGSIPGRFAAFDIPTIELDSSDVLDISEAAQDILSITRESSSPHALILQTCRFGPHSKGDDTRPPEEIARMRSQRDPVEIHAARLEPALRQSIYASVDEMIAQAYQQALADPYPPTKEQPIKSEKRGARL